MSTIDSRFRGLERARTAPEVKSSPISSEGRFDDAPPPVPAADAPPEPAPHFGARFSEPAPAPVVRERDPAPDLLAAESADDQPFARCMHCEYDNSRFVTECSHCKRSLDTAEQRAFNLQLWTTRKEAEKAEQDEWAAKREQDEVEYATAQRTYAELLASRSAQQSKERLGWMEGYRDPANDVSIGMRLLRLIPNARARLAASLGLLGLGVLAATQWYANRMTARSDKWELLFLLIAVLFVRPGSIGRRLWYWR